MSSPQRNFCPTELGMGEHVKNQHRLQLERHQEFQDHLTEESNAAPANWDRQIRDAQTVTNQMSSSSAACIGWSQSDDYSERKRVLGLQRRAEYEVHMAMKDKQKLDKGIERKQQQEQDERDDEEAAQKREEGATELSETDVRHQKQQEYARQLDDQIEEKRRLVAVRKMREDQGDGAAYSAESNGAQKEEMRNGDGQEEAAPVQEEPQELSESDFRHQRQQEYAKQLRDQIDEKQRLVAQRKQRENQEETSYYPFN